MRTLIVSDIHLGATGRLPQADGELCSLLYREEWEQIILLGDVFDLWLRPLHEIMAEHPTVMAVLGSVDCPIVYVPGNHDAEFRGMQQFNTFKVIWPTYSFMSGDKRITVAHGDAYDEFRGIKSWLGAWLGKIADIVVGWFTDSGVSVQRIFRYSYAETGYGRTQYHQPIMDRAAADLEGDIVVIGHTHVPCSPERVGEKVIVNCGDFGPEHMTYAVVDRGKIGLRTVDSV